MAMPMTPFSPSRLEASKMINIAKGRRMGQEDILRDLPLILEEALKYLEVNRPKEVEIVQAFFEREFQGALKVYQSTGKI